MASAEIDPIPRPPNAKVIAFAVSVVRSKPPDLSVGEYIRLLRLHIAKGSRASAVSSTYHHLDRSAYWRTESERMKSALKSSEDEVIDLQREVASLKAKLETARAANPTKKRKKNVEEVIPYPRSPKKAKADVPSGRGGGLAMFDRVKIEAEFSQAGEIGNILLRSLFHMHAMLKSHHKIEPAVLAYHLVRASSTMPQIILKEVKTFVESDVQDHDGLKKVLLLARRTVTSIVTAFNRLSHVDNDKSQEDKAIHAIVSMFKALLAGVVQLSEAETKKLIMAEDAAKKSAAEKSKSTGKTPRVLNIKEKPSISMYTMFLNSILDLLDPKNESHQGLFEGFTYCVLDNVGARMYHSVFGHARGETLEAEILKSNVPGDPEDSGAPQKPCQDEDLKQVRLEAPYLVALMDRVMGMAPLYLGAAIDAKTGKPKQAHKRASMKGALAVAAKDRLQRTLVTCIFGDSEGMTSDPFAESLKMPADKGSISIPKVKEVEVQDWFKEEMWRLLGWEILSKEGEW